MNPRLEWAVPLVVGLAFGVGLYALAANGDDGPGGGDGPATGASSPSPTPEPPQPILLPFAESWGRPGGNATHILLAPLGRAALLDYLNDTGTQPFGTFGWQGDRVALYTQNNAYTGCQEAPVGSGQRICSDPVWVFGRWVLPRTQAVPNNDTGPRLLHGGYNATKVTAFVFDEQARLLASNADAGDIARFTKHPDYLRLQETAWYLGDNAAAPNGTARLPSFAQPLVDRAMGQLDGLPVGGVASTRSNAYVALYGSLFVTVRVDELVYAP